MNLIRSIYHALLLSCAISQVLCYAGFRTVIPNGENVPHPCNPAWVWEGVGHFARGGGGERNPFGRDFNDQGQQWTEDLCRMDSDGDGKTNGEELGDPNCVWVSGIEPERKVNLSHPGICDPLGSLICRRKFVPNCEEAEFKCDAINDAAVFKHEIRLPRTRVPPRETTYKCMFVELPSDGDYHLIADTPIIDNINIMHHTLLYGCPDPNVVTGRFNEPRDCFMAGTYCEDVIAGWDVGTNGECFNEKAGFRIGNADGAYRVAMFEVHWNNPGLVDGWTDTSGMTLYLTPKLRPYDAGVLYIGQEYLEIPPQETNQVAESTCSASCTRETMSGSIYILSALNHMHYLGRKALTEIVLPNGERRTLADDLVFSYDRPTTYAFKEPIRFDPGHALTMKCHFASTSRTKTTFWGEGTRDEMCYSFLTYYPKQNFTKPGCISWGKADSCELERSVILGCNITMIDEVDNPVVEKWYTDLEESCTVGFCRKECIPVVRRINAHPCFKGVLRREWIQEESSLSNYEDLFYHVKFWGMLQSCDADILRDQLESVTEQNGGTSSSGTKPEV